MPGALAGKVALVTGASSGIGAATALALARADAAVALVARRAARLQDLVGEIDHLGCDAVAFPGDVTDESFATRIVTKSVERFGRLDILVNSAGVAGPGVVENANTADWRRILDVNLLAILYTCKAVIPVMKHSGGDIVNISSTAGRKARGPFGPYSTSKFGLTGLTEGLRQEVGGFGIRVCIVEPGATTTEIAESVSDPALRDARRAHSNQAGAMKPEDVAAAILFVVTLPSRASVSEILIRPTIDTAPL